MATRGLLNIYMSVSFTKTILASISTNWLFFLRVYLKNHSSLFETICWLLLTSDEFNLTDRISQIILIISRSSEWMITSSYPYFLSRIEPSNIVPVAANKPIAACTTPSVLRWKCIPEDDCLEYESSPIIEASLWAELYCFVYLYKTLTISSKLIDLSWKIKRDFDFSKITRKNGHISALPYYD